MSHLTKLDALPVGRSGRIARLDLGPGDSQRLMELGLTRGTPVTVVKLAPLGDPIEIHVRGSYLSVRKALARQVEIEPSEPPDKDGRPSP